VVATGRSSLLAWSARAKVPLVTRPGRLRTFAYLDAEKAEVYRGVMSSFMAAKERFSLHLRPDEVATALSDRGWELERDDVEPALRQLTEWGNLDSSPDTAEVSTVEDFYRERRLYQLSREGEAAERALRVYEEAIRQPGELQTAALADVRDLLRELEVLAEQPIDPIKAHKILGELFRRFEELTEKAQVFLGGLRRTIDLHGDDEDGFLQYKERLIDYLERFIDELIVQSVEISRAIERIEMIGVGSHLEAAAARDRVDRLDKDEIAEESSRRWQDRWNGLRHWFHGTPDSPAQADVLRAAARTAIPALLSAVEAMHDRRIRRTDRHADWRALARWFARAPSDNDAHRLYRVAFAMTPARHLRIDADSLDAMEGRMVAPQLSWLAEPTLRIAPRLRAKGRYSRSGREQRVVDRSEGRALLKEIAEQEARQLEQARRRLVRGRVRLSAFERLDDDTFVLFLELLAQALSQQSDPRSRVEASSTDGSLLICLEPTGDGMTATIRTASGAFHGPDHFVEIHPVEAIIDGQAAE
jgi:uncharacterized protein (TIGR02677 family)